MAKSVGLFPTKTAALKYCKELLAAARNEKLPRYLNAEEHQLLKDVFSRHPDIAIASAARYGIHLYQYADYTQVHPAYFAVTHLEEHNFSYRNAVDGHYSIARILRNAVEPQIQDYRKEHNVPEGHDIHHVIQMKDLIRDWKQCSGYTNKQVVDGSGLDDWKEYHKLNAVLEVLTEEAHKEVTYGWVR